MALPEGFGEGLSADFDWDALKSFTDFETVMRERFPAQAWMLDHPELGPLVKQAVAEEWDPDVLLDKIAKSQWGLDRTSTEESYDIREQNDPEDWQKAWDDQHAALVIWANNLGATLSEDQFNQITTDSLRSAWTDQQITGFMVDATATFTAGSFTAAETAVRAGARANMLQMTDAEVQQKTRDMVSGDMDVTKLTEELRQRAAGKYPSLADLINSGTNLVDYFSDHQQTIADMMGEDVDAIDLAGDPRWAPVLGFSGSPGEAPRPMAAYETAQYVRTLDEYYRRPTGRAELSAGRLRLQSAMGFR